MPANPAKASDVEIDEIEDGYLVYDGARERVHYLNHTAALVLELCTGDSDESEIASVIQRAYELAEAPTAEVEGCLRHLRGEGLIV